MFNVSQISHAQHCKDSHVLLGIPPQWTVTCLQPCPLPQRQKMRSGRCVKAVAHSSPACRIPARRLRGLGDGSGQPRFCSLRWRTLHSGSLRLPCESLGSHRKGRYKIAGLCVLVVCHRGQIAFHSELCSRHCTIVFRFACSVASLSRCLDHHLPGLLSLHPTILAGYLLEQGSPSTWSAQLVAFTHTTASISDTRTELQVQTQVNR